MVDFVTLYVQHGLSCSVCMRAVLWHGTRIRGQPLLSVRTMRSGGHPVLYFSGGSSSIPDETSP
jgi:hypothetical protein